MCHNMSKPYVYPYTMHVSPVQETQFDSTYLTPFEINSTPTEFSSTNK